MSIPVWLRADDCPLLRPEYHTAESASLRLVQRLLELCLRHPELEVILEEIGSMLQADHVLLLQATPKWPVVGQYIRRGLRESPDALPRQFLGEVLDRMAGTWQAPGATSPAYLAAPMPQKDGPCLMLLAVRPRQTYAKADLEYFVAAVHYLGLVLANLESWQRQQQACERLETLLDISQQLAEQRETVPLLKHIAEQASRLLRCERASIFLWDEESHELVGRPALGMRGDELRIADDAGVVGKVMQTGKILQVDDVRQNRDFDSSVDKASGFQTRNLLCVPLCDAEGSRIGVFEVMNKKHGTFVPQDRETLIVLGRQTVAALQNVREYEALLRSHTELTDQARAGCQIIGESTPIVELRKALDRLVRTPMPVLILGESGTGKEVVARALHYRSKRQGQPFVPVNCAAIAAGLMESELFGHEKGAFTGADQQRAGKFEAAHGGTIFLDEIGDLSPDGQAKLLRVLEEKVVYRVGGSQPIPVDCRVIAATNRDLADDVRTKKFREDLFYRISGVTQRLPPLRERQDDVLVLAEYFLKHFCRDAGRRTLKLSAEAKKRLRHHPWPGNIRELRNIIEHVAHLCPNDKVEGEDLPFIARPFDDTGDFEELTLAKATEMFQFHHIKKAIKRAGTNMSDAAKLLGLHRPNLYRKMRDLSDKVGKSFDVQME